MADLTAPPQQKCPVEAMKDDAFVLAFKHHTVDATRDIFLVRTRKAMQTISEIRHGMVIEAFCQAMASIVFEALYIGMNRSLDNLAQAIVLRRVAQILTQMADLSERQAGGGK